MRFRTFLTADTMASLSTPYFSKTLGDLPSGARCEEGLRGAPGLIIWFPRDLSELNREGRKIAGRLAGAPVWIAWPKKASGRESDLSEPAVRRAGLDYRELADVRQHASLQACFESLGQPRWFAFTTRGTPRLRR